MTAISNTGYKTRTQRVAIPGGEDLVIKSLFDRQQYYDPNGAAERLGICSASWPLFGLLWPSSIKLAAHLSQRSFCPQERILEIGCGLGLPSLVGRRRGARITASDRHPLAHRFLEANAKLNGVPPIKYRHGQWGEQPEVSVEDAGAEPLSARYDLIIGSDLLFDRDTPVELAQFIDDHAQPKAEAWIVDAGRGYRAAFVRNMGHFGFDLIDDLPVSLDDEKGWAGDPYRGRLLKFARDCAPQGQQN